ncbi:MAG TPA: HAD-IA family hydrolase [Acidimicrobiales bacterium]|jgi:putative hydrolase of the HAD superfamily|nr:HAD-IA family hydrolase [Acidimicrobiales bacterium]
MIRAVLFDLDDTLYPQAAFLECAWRDVAAEGCRHGLDESALYEALVEVAAQGSDRGRIIDRALDAVGARDVAIAPLLESFRRCAPAQLTPYNGVVDSLRALRSVLPIALVSDGFVPGQHAKLTALGLDGLFDVIVLSDELGREHRKPAATPFLEALRQLDVAPRHAVMVGDRADKDVAGAAAATMRCIRVLTGEYADLPDDPPAWRVVPDANAAVRLICQLLDERD